MKLFAIFCFSLGLFPLQVNGQGQTMTVIVLGVKNSSGMVRVGLSNSEKEFTMIMWQTRSSMSVSTQAKAGEVQAVFENIGYGTYAISVVHDTNENGKMDSNAVGIPKEGFGFSNNARGIFGPPSFEETKFVWEGQKKIEIILKYY